MSLNTAITPNRGREALQSLERQTTKGRTGTSQTEKGKRRQRRYTILTGGTRSDLTQICSDLTRRAAVEGSLDSPTELHLVSAPEATHTHEWLLFRFTENRQKSRDNRQRGGVNGEETKGKGLGNGTGR